MKLRVVPDKAAALRDVFDWADLGRGDRWMAGTLNGRGTKWQQATATG